jgi:hypothetical protein
MLRLKVFLWTENQTSRDRLKSVTLEATQVKLMFLPSGDMAYDLERLHWQLVQLVCLEGFTLAGF